MDIDSYNKQNKLFVKSTSSLSVVHNRHQSGGVGVRVGNGRVFPWRGERENVPVERRTGGCSRGEKGGRMFLWRDQWGIRNFVTGEYSRGEENGRMFPWREGRADVPMERIVGDKDLRTGEYSRGEKDGRMFRWRDGQGISNFVTREYSLGEENRRMFSWREERQGIPVDRRRGEGVNFVTGGMLDRQRGEWYIL